MLKDRFGKVISYLRISATPQCNLKCIYYTPRNPKGLSNFEILTLQEILRISRIGVSIGIKNKAYRRKERQLLIPEIKKRCIKNC